MTPVRFDAVALPATYDRGQILMRVLVLVLLAVLGTPLGWIFGVLYLALPVAAAIVVSTRGPATWVDDVGARLVGALRWLLGAYAYLGLLTDRFPTRADAVGVRYEVDRGGAPTVRSALLRLITSIPAAIFLWLLTIVGGIVWLIGVVAILATESLPGFVVDYQRGLVRMFARFLPHHASLVEGPVPIKFDTGPEHVLAPGPAVTSAT